MSFHLYRISTLFLTAPFLVAIIFIAIVIVLGLLYSTGLIRGTAYVGMMLAFVAGIGVVLLLTRGHYLFVRIFR